MKFLDQIATVWHARFSRERLDLRKKLSDTRRDLSADLSRCRSTLLIAEVSLVDVREQLARREIELRVVKGDLIVINREVEKLVAVNTRDLQRVKAEMAAYSGQVADHTGEGRVRIAETREAG